VALPERWAGCILPERWARYSLPERCAGCNQEFFDGRELRRMEMGL